MCGRYTLTVIDGLESFFELDDRPQLSPRFNIAPTQNVPIIRRAADEERRLEMMRWGLIPSWIDPAAQPVALINARSETADRKPAFREAYRERRCLIPATGFFEWKKTGRSRSPFYFRLSGGGLFALAGLWEESRKGDTPVRSCTVLTTAPNRLVEPIHDRMPAILSRGLFKTWLDPTSSLPELRTLLAPIAAEEMVCHPVSRLVNSSREDSPECIRPVDPEDRKNRFPTLFDR